jgi:hypothetical protein
MRIRLLEAIVAGCLLRALSAERLGAEAMGFREDKTTMPANWKTIALAAGLAVTSSAVAQNKAPEMMPYTTVDHPEFVSASQASFLSDTDVVIGISRGGVTKAYPGADLAQHGVVQDQMPDGPIAITW